MHVMLEYDSSQSESKIGHNVYVFFFVLSFFSEPFEIKISVWFVLLHMNVHVYLHITA